jgi:hypothetical protein
VQTGCRRAAKGDAVMPFGNTLGEFSLKAMSVKQIDLGGGQRRTEIDYKGEVTGEGSGSHYGTLSLVSGEANPDLPMPWSYVGTTLTTTGAIIGVTASGMAQRTGQGQKLRFRGVLRNSTNDPKLAMLNNLIVATESELDSATDTVKGVSCEWK